MKIPDESHNLKSVPQLVKHHNLTELHDEVLFGITNSGCSPLHAVIGPTGVGKTTLLSILTADVRKLCPSTGEGPDSAIPVVRLTAPLDGNSRFSWKACILGQVQILNPPLSQYGRLASLNEKTKSLHTRHLHNIHTVELEQIALDGYRHRRTEFLFMDEAQHILSSKDEDVLIRTLDKLKILSDNLQLKIVLFGTYDLLPIASLNGQLSRRCTVHPFHRYHSDQVEELKHFRNAVHTSAARYSVFEGKLLDEKLPEIHRGSLGLMGIYTEWIDRVAAAAQAHKMSTASWELFEKHKLPLSTYVQIKEEIETGEAQFGYDDCKLADFDNKIKDRDKRVGFKNPAKTNSKGRRPGRLPGNDKCGT